MQIPKEIADKVCALEAAIKLADALRADIDEWIEKNTNVKGCDIGTYFLTKTPEGSPKDEDEYYIETRKAYDWWDCVHYHKVEGSDDEWVGYYFDASF